MPLNLEMNHCSEEQPWVSSILPKGSALGVELGGVRHTHQALMIKSPDQVTMSVSFHTTHKPSNCSGLVECEASPPALVVRWGGGRHRARHPPLMDGGHYGSWGQVPLTIKDLSQWLGKKEVETRERKERETVAAERVNTDAAGKADTKQVVRWRGRRGRCR